MSKVRDIFSGISIKWLAVVAIIILAPLVGLAVAAGKTRTVAIIFLPFGLLAIASFSRRLKFWLLALSIPLSLVQIPSLPIPYGFTLCEIILLALTMDELLFSRNHVSSEYLRSEIFFLLMLFPLGLFAFAGLVTAIENGGITLANSGFTAWHTYCLMPLLWFFLAHRKIHNWEDAWLFVKLSLVTIACYVAMVVWANETRHFIIMVPTLTDPGRLGDYQLIMFGPIRLHVFAIALGSLVALGFPAGIVLWLTAKGISWWRIIAPLMLVGFAFTLIYSAARGATVAAILGIILTILASGIFRITRLWVGIALLAVIIILFGGIILKLFPEQNIARLLTLSQGILGERTFKVRTDALALVWKLTLQKPLGIGYNYVYYAFRIDDALIYGFILETTGILGAFAFLLIVGQLVYKFALIALKSPLGSTRNLAALGLSTLVVGLVAGVSAYDVLFAPVNAFVFWAMMAVCYCAVQIPKLAPLAESPLVRRVGERLFEQ